MVKVIIIDKTGKNKKVTDIKNFDVEKLYKKCNLRKKDNFEKRHTWKMKGTNFYISIYTKDAGRANSENKYDLPPPIDENLYFGSLLLVKHTEEELTNENAKDITLKDWETTYEKLFGGFIDLNNEDSYSEEEEIPEHMKTKSGYSKEGGFIVDDDELDDDDYLPDEDDGLESEEDAEDEGEDNMGHDSEVNSGDEDESDEDGEEYDSDASDLGSELSEESYVDSD